MIGTHQVSPADRQRALERLLASNRGNRLCLIDPFDLIDRQELPVTGRAPFTAQPLWEDEYGHDRGVAFITHGWAQTGVSEALCGREGAI
jgi:hypothetical protein